MGGFITYIFRVLLLKFSLKTVLNDTKIVICFSQEFHKSIGCFIVFIPHLLLKTFKLPNEVFNFYYDFNFNFFFSSQENEVFILEVDYLHVVINILDLNLHVCIPLSL